MSIYLDNQATTPCDPRVVDAMVPFFTRYFGNAHSTEHAFGHDASSAVETARGQVASLIGADPREVVFVSGATEANNLAIKGAVRHLAAAQPDIRRVITVATEHKCVLESVRSLADEGFESVVLPVGPDGRLTPDVLAEALATPTLLVSIMGANNETGVLQDLKTFAPMVRAAGALLHTDLAQLAGKLPVSVRELDCDLASISAHKMYGPKGIGALFVRRRPRVRLAPLFSGGGQERAMRSGTLPVPLIVGFGCACAIAMQEMGTEAERAGCLRERFWETLDKSVPGLTRNGSVEHSLPGALNLRLPRPHTALDLIRRTPGVAVSTGSACSSAEIVPSYVLTAMGLDADAASRSLRLSIGRYTSTADIDRAAASFAAALTEGAPLALTP